MPRQSKSTTLTEKFETNKAHAILKNPPECLAPSEVDKLRTYLKHSKKINGSGKPELSSIKTNYYYAKGAVDKGRQFATIGSGKNQVHISQQSLAIIIRHTIAGNLYNDVDFENCHPVIAQQLFKSHNRACPVLNEYVENREHFLSAIAGDRGEAKRDFLRVLNGGQTVSTSIIMRNWEEEAAGHRSWLWDNYPQYHKYTTKGKDNNKKGSLTSFILCDLENTCLLALKKYFDKEGFEVGVLIFDGLQLLQDTKRPITAELLDKASNFVRMETGYGLKIVEKPMDKWLTLDSDISSLVSPSTVETIKDVGFDTTSLTWETPETFQCSVVECPLCKSSHENATFTIADEALSCDKCDCTVSLEMDDRKAAKRLIRQSSEKGYKVLSCEKRVYVYAPQTGIYEPCSKTQGYRNLRLALAECRGMGKYAGSTPDQMKMFSQVVDIAEEETDLWAKSAITSKCKLHFQDCIYDFYTGKTCEFTPDIVAMYKLPLKYPSHITEEQIEYVRKNFYETIFDEKTTYVLQTLARGLAGHIEDKQFVVGTGEGNNGKSVLRESLLDALPNYSTGFDYKDMVFNKNASDTGRANKLSFQLRGTRLAFSSECSQDVKISATILKTVTGGDKSTGRQLYENDVQITPSCTPMMFGNDMPKIDHFDKAVANRLVNLPFDTTFVKGRDSKPNTKERKADDGIVDYMKTEAGKVAHIALLLRSYSPTLPQKPESVMEASQEVTMFEYEDSEAVLKELFEFVPHATPPTSTIAASTVYKCVKDKGVCWGKSKIGRQMKKLGARYNNNTATYENIREKGEEMNFSTDM